MIAILRHGDFFGEGCLARQSLRTSTATAIQSPTIARVKRATIVRIIRQEPAFAKRLYLISSISYGANRRGVCGPNLQFQRKTIGQSSVTVGRFWPAIKTRAGPPEGEPGNTRRNGWHHTVQSELLHEPIPGKWGSSTTTAAYGCTRRCSPFYSTSKNTRFQGKDSCSAFRDHVRFCDARIRSPTPRAPIRHNLIERVGVPRVTEETTPVLFMCTLDDWLCACRR